MKSHLFLLCTLLVLVDSKAELGPPDAVARREQIRKTEMEIRQVLAGKTADELGRVQQLIQHLEFRSDDPPEIRVPLAELRLELLLRAIAQIDTLVDPKFSPNNPDYRSSFTVPYPQNLMRSDGSRDEKVWAEYQASVKANEAKAARTQNMDQLKHKRHLYIAFAWVLSIEYFQSTPEGRALVEEKIAEFISNKLLAAQLKQKLLIPMK